ncbi:MAG: hypothetical protein U0074_08920 [Kouleothrix sp.]
MNARIHQPEVTYLRKSARARSSRSLVHWPYFSVRTLPRYLRYGEPRLHSATAGGPLVLVQPASGGYLGSTPELAQRQQLASQGVEPYKSACSNALSFANGKLSSNPSPQNPLNISGTTGPFVTIPPPPTAWHSPTARPNVAYAKKSRDFIMAW